MVFGSRRAGNRDFSVRMKSLLAANRAYHDRAAPASSEEPNRHVDLLDIDEPPGSNLDMRITFTISSHGSIVVYSCGEVAEMSGRQSLACSDLKIHNIEGLVRRCNDLFVLLQHVKNSKGITLCCGVTYQPVCDGSAKEMRTGEKRTC